MSRRRNHSFSDPNLSPELHGGFMESGGSLARLDGDFLEAESDEELLCSVSDITEHLGRNITVVLQTALSEIRKMVSIRIRVLKMELREKNDEISALKARLTSAHRDAKEAAMDPPEAAFRKPSSTDPRRAKTASVPAVKKENIDAICDYLMKDKNSRGGPEPDGENGEREARPEADPLGLWPDGGLAGAGPPAADSESSTDDIFSMIPSSSKRMYEYDWMPMEYSADLKERETKTENTDEDEGEHDVSLKREEDALDETSLSQVHTPDFMDPQSSPGEGGSPAPAHPERPETGPTFPSHTYICSLCGTFCPDALFLEEHVRLIHSEAAALQALKSSAGAASNPGDGGGGGGDPDRTEEPGAAMGVSQDGTPFKKVIKLDSGYQCGECGRHFNYLGNLRQHQRIHTGEKPFTCPDCGERFRHAARLKSHRLVHSGDQSPFPCPQCGKGFSVLSGLKRHQRVHTGESPYACPQCGRRFKELGNLYTHQRIHSGATPYCCQQCGRRFRHLGTYKSHRCMPTE